MNFRAQAEMLVLFPKRILATWKDNSMPKQDWSKFDEPAVQRKRTANSWRFDNARRAARRT
jgi:hypothetical protein